MNTLYILRSVSGAGKTTLAKQLEQMPNTKAIAADDFWYEIGLGEYKFDINRLGEAHQWCQKMVDVLMVCQKNVVLHNTNTTEKEIKPYLDMAEKYGYNVVSLVVENRHGNSNVHDVPENVLRNQEERLRNSIKLS